jgi:hypothetical protein
MKKQHLVTLALLCLSVIGHAAYSQTTTTDWTDKVQLGLRAGFSIANMSGEMAGADTKGKLGIHLGAWGEYPGNERLGRQRVGLPGRLTPD